MKEKVFIDIKTKRVMKFSKKEILLFELALFIMLEMSIANDSDYIATSGTATSSMIVYQTDPVTWSIDKDGRIEIIDNNNIFNDNAFKKKDQKKSINILTKVTVFMLIMTTLFLPNSFEIKLKKEASPKSHLFYLKMTYQ